MNKIKISLHYYGAEDDSDHMSSRDLEDEKHEIEISNKEDVINFLKSLEYVHLNEEIMKELLEDNDFVVNEDLDKIYVDSDSHDWVSTSYGLRLKAKY